MSFCYPGISGLKKIHTQDFGIPKIAKIHTKILKERNWKVKSDIAHLAIDSRNNLANLETILIQSTSSDNDLEAIDPFSGYTEY